MADARKVGMLVAAAVLAAAAFFVGLSAGNLSLFSSGEPYTEVGPTVVDRIRDLAELTTVEMVESTTIEKGNDHGWLNWARGDRVFMLAVAKVGAGVDLQRLYVEDVSAEPSTGVVTVTLPEPHITYVAVDNNQTQVIDRATGLFTKGDPQLESDARAVAEEVLRQSAIEHGILDRARSNAEQLIEAFLLELGYSDVVFTAPPDGRPEA